MQLIVLLHVLLVMSSVQNTDIFSSVPIIKAYPADNCYFLGILNVIVGHSLEHCATQCIMWKKCAGISYNRQMAACSLIGDNFNEDSATVEDTACINLDTTELLHFSLLTVGACAGRPCSDKDECKLKHTGGEYFECIPKECPESLDAMNVTISYGDRLVGSTNNLKCREGYTMFGNSRVTCATDGQWTISDFQCHKNCQMPSLPNAYPVSFNPRLAYNTTIEFMCNDKFTLVGKPTIACLNNGVWSNSEFSCYPNCETPSIQNTYVLMDESTFAFNTSAILKCDDGYTASGELTVTCLKNSEWSLPESACYPNCGMPNVPNAHPVTANMTKTFNTSVIFSCDYAYSALGNVTVTCLSTGEWSKPVFECHPNCQTPNVENADVVTLDPSLAYNTIATIKCDNGFYSNSSRNTFTIRCEANGEWSQTESCFEYCPDPPTVSNAVVQGPTKPYKMDMSVEYICNGGYYAVSPDDSTIHCLKDGTWTNTDFSCNKYCASLPVITDANRVATPNAPYTTASSARYQCKTLYHHFGTFAAVAEYHCNGNGDWKGNLKCCPALYEWSDERGRCCMIVIGGLVC